MSLAVYHVGEYLATAYFHPNKVTWESFLINHSTEYGVAIVASYIELGSKFVLAYYFDIAALMRMTMHIGLLMICVGHLFRLGGLISGGTNFTHKIRWKNEPTHQLVIGGFFAICRHPGYFGWYIWSVGTQILVLNPVCILGFAKAARDFFSSRIEAEEYSLHERFGGDYMNYTKVVPRFPLKLDALMLSR
jgi:protein-S-isoprenylcysteine O-methyltransferase